MVYNPTQKKPIHKPPATEVGVAHWDTPPDGRKREIPWVWSTPKMITHGVMILPIQTMPIYGEISQNFHGICIVWSDPKIDNCSWFLLNIALTFFSAFSVPQGGPKNQFINWPWKSTSLFKKRSFRWAFRWWSTLEKWRFVNQPIKRKVVGLPGKGLLRDDGT